MYYTASIRGTDQQSKARKGCHHGWTAVVVPTWAKWSFNLYCGESLVIHDEFARATSPCFIKCQYDDMVCQFYGMLRQEAGRVVKICSDKIHIHRFQWTCRVPLCPELHTLTWAHQSAFLPTSPAHHDPLLHNIHISLGWIIIVQYAVIISSIKNYMSSIKYYCTAGIIHYFQAWCERRDNIHG